MMDPPINERFCLRVRNLPTVLSTEAITSLFSYYGATRVHVLKRRNAASSGKEPGAEPSKRLQKAVATFSTREAQQNAQKRLHSLELAGHHLQVEMVGDEAATTSIETKPESREAGSNVSLSYPPPLPKGLMLTVASWCGSLNYAPSPLLEYKYPKATESIVRNIANGSWCTLIALPRFYTQVLHLMNKMNLPPPFEEDAIPGRFSVKQDKARETGGVRKLPFMESYVRGLPSSSIMVKNVARGVDEKDLRFVFGYVLPLDVALDSIKVNLLPANGSALIDYPNKEVATTAVNELHGVQLEGKTLIVSFHNTLIPTVARWTLEELASKRLLEAQLASEKVMKKYQVGEPSNSLYVKNLAKTVELADLFAVFGAVLPPESGLEYVAFLLSCQCHRGQK
ncbi:hypothetical protein JG687_00000982 [Phytophthora cactorum]|uniref:RRM domain-containing protein n=1 Tax=Phytophthora cactorum TaxID=29920 RepID=A0A8T1UZ75_9STRA|nr:hypothetical protein JG687_00000982 [Phytophthora cactorum]